ncbi:MAG TPA: hypothetical protein DCS29_04035 [Candidatus Magasanikbacteria bacterium]|nr:MAG: hypothetical protein A2479_01025 [Candidatus Magasanikbacteria bacterium RIFOXYC2_FULL_39_8]HAT03913.1 hypothetical protein [Candidatus Magasanikbacteria bacterium]
MNLKRAFGYGAMLWVIIFVVISILIFLPWFKDSEFRVDIAWYILEIPIVLIWAKMYFKADPPTTKKGLMLGLVALVAGTILDMIITVPLFVKSYAMYFGDWMLYIGYVELLVLTTYAGYEFDGTYTKESKKSKEEIEHN